MSSYLDNLHEGSLQLAHYVLHETQGEDGPLLLLKHDELTGGLVELTTLPVGQFTVADVQAAFDGFNDGSTAAQRTISVLGAAITPAILSSLVCVEWQSTRYKLAVLSAPESTRRKWSFLATPMERS